MLDLSIVGPPDDEPLTAAQARARVLSLSGITDDAVVKAYVSAARSTIDGANGWLGRAICAQQWKLTLDAFDPSMVYPPVDKGFYSNDWAFRAYYYDRIFSTFRKGIELPLPPLISVDSIKYLDEDEVEQTVATDVYRVVGNDPARIYLAAGQSWPATSLSPGAVAITFTCGYGDADDVPENIRMAIALMAGQLRSMTGNDLRVTSETIGQLTRSYATGDSSTKAAESMAECLLAPYRIIGK